MFEKLIDFIIQFWHSIVPFVVVVPSQNAGVLRFGLYHRTLPPGIHWKWPLAESVNEQNVCVTTMRLPAQTLTSLDGKALVVTCIVKYEIKDIRPYITDVYDANDVLADITMGAVARAVRSADSTDLLAAPPESAVLDLVRKEVNQYGFKVHRVTFTDFAVVRSFRMIQDHAKDLSN